MTIKNASRGRYDTVHRLLDPSQVHALTDEELAELVTVAVGTIGHHSRSESPPMRVDTILTDASDRGGLTVNALPVRMLQMLTVLAVRVTYRSRPHWCSTCRWSPDSCPVRRT